MQSIKMQRLFDRHILREYPCNDIGHLATFLTGDVYDETYNYWLNFTKDQSSHNGYETGCNLWKTKLINQ